MEKIIAALLAGLAHYTWGINPDEQRYIIKQLAELFSGILEARADERPELYQNDDYQMLLESVSPIALDYADLEAQSTIDDLLFALSILGVRGTTFSRKENPLAEPE